MRLMEDYEISSGQAIRLSRFWGICIISASENFLRDLLAAILGIAILAHPMTGLADDTTDVRIDPEQIEADGATIGKIVLDKHNVFDLDNPDENKFLYRLANRWHIVTRDDTISDQLLFESGDPYSRRVIDETERILRGNKYFYDASIEPLNYRDGIVDLKVTTRDVWTISPGLSLKSRGGEDEWSVELEEDNFLGRGQMVRFARTSDVDRESTSFEFRDRNLGSSWVSTQLVVSDTSDGYSNLLSIGQPFYALDTRWSAGATVFDDKRVSSLYQLGTRSAVYQHERQAFSAFAGWSSGLQGNWVQRLTVGVASDDNRFSDAFDATLPSAVPVDRNLVYPFFGIEIVEDRFEKARNRDQIRKTEDFYTGTRIGATLGWSDRAFSAERDALIYTANASSGFGTLDANALLLSAWASGRREGSDIVNALVSIDARYFRRQSQKRVFYATLEATKGHDLDLDNPVSLGGTTGLRGYPLRYQSGDSKVLVSVEQRYFTDWYPFRFVRVGGAVFFDAGRTWGDNPLGGSGLGWLRDVGVGLRLSPTRMMTDKVIHLDLAFPLDGDASIDSVQILLESRRSF